MRDEDVETIASALMEAERERASRAAFTAAEFPDLDEATAYRVQDRTLELREQRGERLIGIKLGLTSKAKQRQMEVETPLVGWLTDAHRLGADVLLPPARYIQPRAEPEVIVTLAHGLRGPGVTADDVRSAIAWVHGGVDVIDSRYAGYAFRLADVVADNSSSGGFVEGGTARRIDDVDLEREAVVVEIDGQIVDSATGAAVLGHPLQAVAEGVNLLARRGRGLNAGHIVLAGAMTQAVPVDAGSFLAFHFSTLGSIYLRGRAGDAPD